LEFYNLWYLEKIGSDMKDRKKEKQLRSRNIKPTAMRELVLDVLSRQTAAIGLPELEEHFEKADRTTLYRTLKTFEEKKLIHKIDDGTGTVKYALCSETCECEPDDLHVHFLCEKCEKTYCLYNIPVPTINLPPGFQLDGVNMVVNGICSNCRT
jgi:Fur family ferric uptake transcriptional regulator